MRSEMTEGSVYKIIRDWNKPMDEWLIPERHRNAKHDIISALVHVVLDLYILCLHQILLLLQHSPSGTMQLPVDISLAVALCAAYANAQVEQVGRSQT